MMERHRMNMQGFLTDVPLVIDADPEGIENEMYGNLCSIETSQAIAADVNADELAENIGWLIDRRSDDLRERQHVMLFYCWVETFPALLRFSMVYASHGQIPLVGHIQRVSISRLMHYFLDLETHDGRFLNDNTEYEFEDTIIAEDSSDTDDPMLYWCAVIPAGTAEELPQCVLH